MFVSQSSGEIAVWHLALTRTKAEGEVFAARDTKLIRFRGSELPQVMAANHELIVANSQYAIYGMKRSHGMSAVKSRPLSFALLPTREDTRMGEVADALLQALGDIAGPGALIDSRRLQNIFGREISEATAFESVRDQLVRRCEAQEAEGRFLLFVCDPTGTEWTRWCLKQTDRIVIVAGAEATA